MDDINEHLRYVALGDSYTLGEGIQPVASWPRQLVGSLQETGYRVEELQIIAQTGWTTSDLAGALSTRDLTGPYALVTLQIGVNDQYQGIALQAYPPRFDSLLAQAIELAGGQPARVLVVSIPDWSVTPFAAGRPRAKLRQEIGTFNHLNRTHSEARKVRFIDITPLSREAEGNPALLAGDGLHLSARMYRQWVRVILPHAQVALSIRQPGNTQIL